MATYRTSHRFNRVYATLVALLVLHVQEGQGWQRIKCFSCSSKMSEACTEPDTSQFEPVTCDTRMLGQMRDNAKDINMEYEKIFDVDAAHLGGVNLVCLKVVVKDGNKDYVMRGCQLGLPSNLDICSKVEEKDTGLIKKVHCSTCNKDGCNASMTFYQFNVALTLACLAVVQAFYKLL